MTQTHSISQSWSTGLSGLFKQIITESVDYTWTDTVLTSTAYTTSCQTGHIAFDPYYKFVKGTYWMTGCGKPDSDKTNFQGRTPQKGGGSFARGNVYLVSQNTPCGGKGGGGSGGCKKKFPFSHFSTFNLKNIQPFTLHRVNLFRDRRQTFG